MKRIFKILSVFLVSLNFLKEGISMENQETNKVSISFRSYYLKSLKFLSLERNEGKISYETHKVGELIEPKTEFKLSIIYSPPYAKDTPNQLTIGDDEGNTASLHWVVAKDPICKYISIDGTYSNPRLALSELGCDKDGYVGIIINPEDR